jgi:hypothetical protein
MVERIATGVWEFVVGDDWRVAVGGAGILAATTAAAALGLPAWWLAPVATVAVLHASVRRGAARSPRRG